MKKHLNTAGITNELAGASAFFPRPTPPLEATSTKPLISPQEPSTGQTQQSASVSQQDEESGQVEAASPVLPARPMSKQRSMKASTLASYPDSTIETIRKAVKHPGREVTFVRLTPEEKSRLADIVYTYKRQGIKTSENEISRIAITYLFEDYQATGQESILAKVIASLLA